MTGSPPPIPHDEELPIATELLRPEQAAAHLRAHLAAAPPFDTVRIRYVAYTPGEQITVQLQGIHATGRFDAAVTATPHAQQVFQYPDDPALPLLGNPVAIAAALDLVHHAPRERLAWVPTQRAALRLGPTVVKLYAEPGAAVDSFRLMQLAVDAVPTALPLAVDGRRGLVAQTLVPGRTLERSDALAWAPRAVALLEQLRDAELADLAVVGPDELLAMAEGPVALVGFVRPELGARLQRAAAVLHRTRPRPRRRDHRPCHGDFNVGQLLADGERLTVVDVDTLCAAAPAFDLAAFATNVISGRPGDIGDAAAILRAVERACTRPPEDLSWYVGATVLRRVDRAIRRFKGDWPERTAALVVAVEQAAAAL